MKGIGLFNTVLFLFLFLFSACQPLVEANAPQSTNTVVLNTPSVIPTETYLPQITITATFTPKANTCVTDQQLPNPDIPENYIGGNLVLISLNSIIKKTGMRITCIGNLL